MRKWATIWRICRKDMSFSSASITQHAHFVFVFSIDGELKFVFDWGSLWWNPWTVRTFDARSNTPLFGLLFFHRHHAFNAFSWYAVCVSVSLLIETFFILCAELTMKWKMDEKNHFGFFGNFVGCFTATHAHRSISIEICGHHEAIEHARSSDRSMCQLPIMCIELVTAFTFRIRYDVIQSESTQVFFLKIVANKTRPKRRKLHTLCRIAALNCCRQIHVFFSYCFVFDLLCDFFYLIFRRSACSWLFADDI